MTRSWIHKDSLRSVEKVKTTPSHKNSENASVNCQQWLALLVTMEGGSQGGCLDSPPEIMALHQLERDGASRQTDVLIPTRCYL